MIKYNNLEIPSGGPYKCPYVFNVMFGFDKAAILYHITFWALYNEAKKNTRVLGSDNKYYTQRALSKIMKDMKLEGVIGRSTVNNYLLWLINNGWVVDRYGKNNDQYKKQIDKKTGKEIITPTSRWLRPSDKTLELLNYRDEDGRCDMDWIMNDINFYIKGKDSKKDNKTNNESNFSNDESNFSSDEYLDKYY